MCSYIAKKREPLHGYRRQTFGIRNYRMDGNKESMVKGDIIILNCGCRNASYKSETADKKKLSHASKTTTYGDPRAEWEDELHPKPRIVELYRDPEIGFGFVAGAEQPVIVRYVTEGGPSEGKLLPGDKILKINDEDVQDYPRDQVIQLVRNCKDTVRLKVTQPALDVTAKKSAFLSSAKKAKLKTNPSRVRFAEGVCVNGSPPISTPFSGGESCVPPMPNVLKVFLENGQTKSFKYDSTTKVKDVTASLKHKLCIQRIQHFALVLEQVKSLRRNKLTLLNPEHTIARIASRPGIHNMRCLFRVAFVPRDACDLAQQDLTAFEYLYLQCCNDVVHERYAPELKYDTALRLAALHIHQHAISNNIPYNKVTVKSIEKEFGLDKFVPVSLMESMKRRELRKLLTHLLKLNQTITGTAHKTLTSLQAKLYYLTIISELPSYGAKCFSTGIRECNAETVILVSPKLGISQISGIRNSVPLPIADIEQLEGVRVQMNDQVTCLVTLYIPSVIQKEMSFTMEDRDAEEFVLVLVGYYRLLTERELYLDLEKDIWNQDTAPTYHARHTVAAAPWSYLREPGTELEKFADFTNTPKFSCYPDNTCSVNSNSNGNGTLRNPSHIKYPQTDNHRIKFNTMITDQNGYLVSKASHSNSSPLDLQSVISMEILENDMNYADIRNQDVIKRITELQQMVENSEQYLTQHQRESSDSDNSHISLESEAAAPPPGQLKHSDSLTLLAQSHANVNERLYEAMKALQLADLESDTDSICTPSNSPSRANANRNRDSNLSFGLHSPDNMLSQEQQNMEDWWRKMQDETDSSEFADPCYFVESDFVDLTLLPPPPLPASLKDEDRRLIESRAPPPPSFCDENTFSPSTTEQQRHDELLDTALSKVLNNDKILSLDLDSFLATMTVPPPTPNAAVTSELTSTQISSFIIPPPPANQEKSSSKLPNGHAIVVDKLETLQQNTATSPTKEIVQVNGTNSTDVEQLTKNEMENSSSTSTLTNKKRTAPPKLPPRTDSLNSLTKRPLPPTPSQNSSQNIYLDESQEAIEEVLKLIEEHKIIVDECETAQAHGGGSNINELKFQEIIQELTGETKTLVSSSKSLIRSYMDPSSCDFSVNLSSCVKQLKTLIELSRRLVTHTASPLQTRNLILKVLDVINSFHECITTKNIETETITKHAENLANVLATLLRSLRIFSP
ncbi:FERM and PDZ domain-containing protein 4 isoform X5 [Planococcus citri]|uniref:FERM and PDZ domain-containing protein 4 isoform X5 n=2 Tax=Planococcus citri TaxID=170843 RepID=UPI0031F7E721